MVVVAQLVSASGCGPEGRRFKSGLPPHFFCPNSGGALLRISFFFVPKVYFRTKKSGYTHACRWFKADKTRFEPRTSWGCVVVAGVLRTPGSLRASPLRGAPGLSAEASAQAEGRRLVAA